MASCCAASCCSTSACCAPMLSIQSSGPATKAVSRWTSAPGASPRRCGPGGVGLSPAPSAACRSTGLVLSWPVPGAGSAEAEARPGAAMHASSSLHAPSTSASCLRGGCCCCCCSCCWWWWRRLSRSRPGLPASSSKAHSCADPGPGRPSSGRGPSSSLHGWCAECPPQAQTAAHAACRCQVAAAALMACACRVPALGTGGLHGCMAGPRAPRLAGARARLQGACCPQACWLSMTCLNSRCAHASWARTGLAATRIVKPSESSRPDQSTPHNQNSNFRVFRRSLGCTCRLVAAPAQAPGQPGGRPARHPRWWRRTAPPRPPAPAARATRRQLRPGPRRHRRQGLRLKPRL